MEYVIKNSRLKDFLYNLGFNFRQVPDQTKKQDWIWLFPNTEQLKEAITFYTKFKSKNKESNIIFSTVGYNCAVLKK
jgi:hypothetical protein